MKPAGEWLTNPEDLPDGSACAGRAGVGIASAIALHFTMYFVGSVAVGVWERKHGAPVVYGDSPLWVLLWSGALVALMWKGKPRLVEVIVPFTLWVGYWFIGMVATNFHPDTAEQAEVAAFSLAMFLGCFGVWGLGLLLVLVRWGLGKLGR